MKQKKRNHQGQERHLVVGRVLAFDTCPQLGTGFHFTNTGFYRVLPSLPGFTGFYWVLLGFTGFYRVLPSFNGELLGFTQFRSVLT